MINFTKKPLLNNDLPKEISKFITDELTNYIVIKDGHVLIKNLSESYEDVEIKAAEYSKDRLVYKQYGNLFETEDEALKYNYEETNSGLLIHVPKGFAVKDPLHVFYVQENEDLVNNTFIILETSSELNYFEYLYNMNPCHINFVSNSILKQNSKLNYTGISKLTAKAVATVNRNSYIKRYANAEYNVAEINDATIDSNTTIKLLEEYAVGTTKTVAITSLEQEARFTQLVEHKAPDTEGYIDNYGVSNNNSILVFEGIGKINKNMKRSIARQSNKGIVLGINSRLDANPLLLIDEFDVIASHGAAIGKMDDEQLYYLMSRGLTLKNAERLIISGFLSPVLKKLSTDELKEDFVLTVENKTL
jgi:Fe-S cluster assembly protein SufD